MTASKRGRDAGGHRTPPPMSIEAAEFGKPARRANDNLKGPWPLFPFPEIFDAAPTAATALLESTSDNPRRWSVVVVAYGVIVGTATIAWFYLLILTLLRAVEWALGL
jgi:hypothetical protein